MRDVDEPTPRERREHRRGQERLDQPRRAAPGGVATRLAAGAGHGRHDRARGGRRLRSSGRDACCRRWPTRPAGRSASRCRNSRIGVLPDDVSFAQAATLPVAGLTALRALRLGGSLLGRSVLVTGATGGVGQIAVQLAARSGAHVTGTSRHPERGAASAAVGRRAAHQRRGVAHGPFDLILESVGGESLTAALRLVGRDGTVVLFGNSSGEDSTVNFGGLRWAAARAAVCVFRVRVRRAADVRVGPRHCWPPKSAPAASSRRSAWRQAGAIRLRRLRRCASATSKARRCLRSIERELSRCVGWRAPRAAACCWCWSWARQ